MPLQQLPPEIFAKIIIQHALQVGLRNLLKHRLVSTTFNTFIMDAIFSVAASDDAPLSTGSEAFTQIFTHHAGEILARRVLHRGFNSDPFLQFLKSIVDAMMPSKGRLSIKKESELRERITRHICHAANALEPHTLLKYVSQGVSVSNQGLERLVYTRTAVAAAVGNVASYLKKISDPRYSLRTDSYFTNALEAAVAANQKNTVDVILKHVSTGNGGDLRKAAWGLYDALLVAIRLHRHFFANKIVEVLAKNKSLGLSVPHGVRWRLHEVCIKHENVEFYCRAPKYKRGGNWESLIQMQDTRLDPTKEEARYMLRRCTKWMLRRLIETKQFDANNVGEDKTPIFLALSVRRRDLVEVLLEGGADINSNTRAGGGTALYRAKMMGWYRDAEYLEFDLYASYFGPSK